MSEINKLLSKLTIENLDNKNNKNIKLKTRNYNELSAKIISFDLPESDKINSNKDMDIIRLNNLRSFENQSLYHNKPFANVSSLNRNYHIDKDNANDINRRLNNYEPLPRNQFNNDIIFDTKYELNKNNFKEESNNRIQKIDNVKTNRITNNQFNTMMFSTKKRDNNNKYQEYTPLPRNVNYSINNKNKMISNNLIPSNSRCNYNFSN